MIETPTMAQTNATIAASSIRKDTLAGYLVEFKQEMTNIVH